MAGFFIIIGVAIDDYQRDLVHSEVKLQSGAWWHQNPDVWLTDAGESPQWWLDRLGVVVPRPPATIVVVQLPFAGTRAWTARGPTYMWGWFLKNYASPEGGPPDPNFSVPLPPPPTSFDEEPF